MSQGIEKEREGDTDCREEKKKKKRKYQNAFNYKTHDFNMSLSVYNFSRNY